MYKNNSLYYNMKIVDSKCFVERLQMLLLEKDILTDIYLILSVYIKESYFINKKQDNTLTMINNIENEIKIKKSCLDELEIKSKSEFNHSILQQAEELQETINKKNKELKNMIENNKELYKYKSIETFLQFRIEVKKGNIEIDRYMLDILEGVFNIQFIVLDNADTIIHENYKKDKIISPQMYIILNVDYRCISYDNVFNFSVNTIPDEIMENIVNIIDIYEDSCWEYNKDIINYIANI